MIEISTDIKKATEYLESGRLVAIPTETVYGLAGLAKNISAITQIFNTKNRPFFDPLICHYSSVAAILSHINKINERLLPVLEKFMPGPLTVLVQRPQDIPPLVTAGSDFVAVRVPAHNLTLRLLEEIKTPLAAPSANPFGYISPTRPEHVAKQLGHKIPMILDGGPCTVGLESTIISLTQDVLAIHRYGAITPEDLRAVLPKAVKIMAATDAGKVLPGTLPGHYAPKKSLMLFENFSQMKSYLGNANLDTVTVLLNNIYAAHQFTYPLVLSEDGNLDEIAANLFDLLRKADDAPETSLIVACLVDNKGLGLAINDRLKRAAQKSQDLD